ncbi:hypothetical protein D3C76_626990 [compost metagenome]
MDRTLRMSFTVCTRSGAYNEVVDVSEVVAAGWVGRRPEDLEKHIAEMQVLGISRPVTVPLFNRVANSRLTQRETIEVLGSHSSGEVEFVLVQSKGNLYVGVGSDHSDNRIETFCMAAAKQVYDKSIAPVLWRYEEVVSHWDKLILRSYITVDNVRYLYQQGPVDGVLHPETLINNYAVQDGKLSEGAVLYGGTFSTQGGVRSGSRFEYELEDPVLNRVIRHHYCVYELPFAQPLVKN